MRILSWKKATQKNDRIAYYDNELDFYKSLVCEKLNGGDLWHYNKGDDDEFAECLENYDLADESGWYLIYELLSQKLCSENENALNAYKKAVEVLGIFNDFHYIYDVDKEEFVYVAKGYEHLLQELKENSKVEQDD